MHPKPARTAKPDERKFGTWYIDQAHPDKEIDIKDIVAYCQNTYGLDVTHMKVPMKMVMHIDGSDFFSWVHECDIGGHKFTKCSCDKRTGEDAMLWAGSGE